MRQVTARKVDKTGLSQSLVKSLIRKVIQRPCQQKQSAARSQAERPLHGLLLCNYQSSDCLRSFSVFP